ncbi:SDR family NAD(P)-dependent oxidoreductase [Caenibius tardaugens NBRC 16725]|nr:SDR family NAD(P)-dependent oxidoreductase [Caenibius tardaugens NBRC 16725]
MYIGRHNQPQKSYDLYGFAKKINDHKGVRMNSVRFDDQVAIVTGAGRGLGREYALLLAARGAKVVVNDYACAADGSPDDNNPADDVVREIEQAGGSAVAARYSVTDNAAAIVDTAISAFGRLDILVNNAGISGGGWFAEIPIDDWARMIDTHLGGTVAVTRAAWPHLARQGAARIINSSSNASFGAPFTTHYSTAKSAMIGFTRSLAEEGGAAQITVNAVMPAAYTRLTAQIPDPVLRDHLAANFQPERVAAFVGWLLSTEISGEIFSVGAGRAARVVLAEGPAALVAEDTPEAWSAVESQVMSLNGLRAPLSLIDELCEHLGDLGGDSAAIATTIRELPNWKP